MAAVVILMWMSSKLIFLTPVLIQYFLLYYNTVYYDFIFCGYFAVAWAKRQNYTGRLSLIKKSTFRGGEKSIFFPFTFGNLVTEYRFVTSL